MAWDYRRYGSITDPIHKSHLNTITGDYGCLRKFRFQQDERYAPADNAQRHTVSAKAALGTAVHEVLARVLTSPDAVAAVLSGPGHIGAHQIRAALRFELDLEAGQRVIDWGGEESTTRLMEDRAAMILGTLDNLHRWCAAVELVEAGFMVQLGDLWLSGHVDLIYRPKDNPEGLGLADWKSGAQRPDPIELDHSWECGVYAAAMHAGFFVRRECLQVLQTPDGWTAGIAMGTGVQVSATHQSRYIAERNALEAVLIELAAGVPVGASTVTFSRYPTEIHYVHLGDYVPYVKRGKKHIERPEDLKHWGLTAPGDVGFSPGQTRGPAWLPVRQNEADIPRLVHRLKNIVGTIRMGRFIDMVSERCKRCPYSFPCLNAGYGAVGDERKSIERMIKQLDLET